MTKVTFEYGGKKYTVGVTCLGEQDVAGDFIVVENDKHETLVVFEAVNTDDGPSVAEVTWKPVQGIDYLRPDQQYFCVQV